MRNFLIKFWAGIFIPGWLVIALGFLHAETGKKTVSSSEQKPYSSHELLIQFKSDTKRKSPQLLYSGMASGNFQLDSLNARFQLKKVIPLFTYPADSSGAIESGTVPQIFLFKFARVSSLIKLKKSYESLNIVEFAEFNYHYFADHSTSKKSSLLLQSQLERAAQFMDPNHSVIIGIIDTGIDWNWEPLISSLWNNRLEKLDGKDNDANGLIDDILGWNFVDQDLANSFDLSWENRPIDDCGHGTQICQIIAQISNYPASNKERNNKNQLMILKAGALSPAGNIVFTAFALARAIIYAADNGARIINISGNSENSSRLLQQAIDYAANKGCVIIAAAGDKNSNRPHYPAAFENVWAVTATDDNDEKLKESNSGQWIEIAAPGLTNENLSFSDSAKFIAPGTAIAAANVSGLAGLLLSCEDIANSDSLKRRILWSSENIYHKNSGYSGKLGAGRINVLRAINSQHQPNIIVQKLSYHLKNQEQYLLPVDIVPITINIKNLSSVAQDITIKLTTSDPHLNVLTSEITIPLLDYEQEFSKEFYPFTLIINNDYPAEHEAELMVSIETSNDFLLIQAFTFSNQVSLPKNLTVIIDNPPTLKWTGAPEFISYYIYRKEKDQQSYTRITEVPIIDSSYTDPSIKSGIQYFYYVTGIDTSSWESPPSNIVTIELHEDPKFLFYPIQDTLISNEDSIRFSALPQFDNSENYTYHWLLNGETIDSHSNSFFFESYIFKNNSTDTVTITIDDIELDTTITHHWVINLKNIIKTFEINSVFPATDTTLNAGDSLKFHISVNNTDDDSLTFQWQINDKTIEQARDSVLVLFADSLSDTTNLIKVSISNQDTSVTYLWTVYIVPSFPPVTLDQFAFFPNSDTTIYEGDSLNLKIQFINQMDSVKNFQWQVNDEADSFAQQTSYELTPGYFSAGTDTIILFYEIGDSAGSHQWLVKILDRNRAPEILSYFSPTDTTISREDTLILFIAASDPDQDSLSYQWFINRKTDTTAVDSCYTFFKTENGFEPDTISIQITDNDTAIFHQWVVHYFTIQNQAPQIISYSPSLDSLLKQADSVLFRIHCNDPDGDSLRFTWSVNGWIDTSAHDSAYWYHNLDSTLTIDTLIVTITDADTSIKLEWILWAGDIEPEPIKKIITWFPEEDSLMAEDDSLIFRVQNATDSCRFQWKINSRIDTITNDSIFVYHQSADSIAIDTIRVTVFGEDSIFSHEWRIHNFSSTEKKLPLRLVFKPEQDKLIAAADEDSLVFSTQIIEGEFADLKFQWSINNQLDTTAVDTIFSYKPDYFLAAPDTIQLIVSRGDTSISHQWIVKLYQQQTLPGPHLVFPVEGNRVCEEDKFTWENDSTLAQIDSTGDWNYLVQLSKDTTFSSLISTDSCRNSTSIALNALSGFDRISIGKPIYWRVKVFSGFLKASEFSKSGVPFKYYPQFTRLESFYGEKKEDGTIDLFWTTGYQGNCAGFNVYRSESQDDDFEKVNEYLITGQGEYSFPDITSMAGRTYYYKLEDVSNYGKRKFHHTISITAVVPAKFSLTQNYPNPFNARTSFKYEIPSGSHVKVEVCNVLGRKVKTLVNEKKETGFYIVYWDGIDDRGESVVSGIYFYSLITNKGKITRKMVVVR